jgi:hypothetical protein
MGQIWASLENNCKLFLTKSFTRYETGEGEDLDHFDVVVDSFKSDVVVADLAHETRL